VGTLLTDTVTVTDFPAETATLTAYLAGPFPSRDALRCRTNTSRQVQLTITGPGTFSTPAIRVRQPGWYAWFEVLPATPSSEAVRTPCRIASETSLVTRPVAPAVHLDTGPHSERPSARTSSAYARLVIPSIGIDVRAQATTPSNGVLTPPSAPDRVGWYAATARFADRIGSLVVGGHVSTPTGGRGPFGRLGRVDVGDRVVLTRNGVRRVLEVVSKRSYPRSEPLPTSLFDLTTGFRVVLVTCTHRVVRPDGSWQYTDTLVVIAR
jgi:sortase (surface protein transpeptidase)